MELSDSMDRLEEITLAQARAIRDNRELRGIWTKGVNAFMSLDSLRPTGLAGRMKALDELICRP